MTIQLNGDAPSAYTAMLTPDALDFIADLARAYKQQTASLRKPQATHDCPDAADGHAVNAADLDHILRAVSDGVPRIIADFQDCTPATWEALLRGQTNLRRLTRFNVDYQDAAGNWRPLTPDDAPSVLVRPRPLHTAETHITVDGAPIPAGLFDFGLYVYYNAAELVIRGLDVEFYLKDTDSAEKRLWEQIAGNSSATLGLPSARIKVH